MLTIAYALNFVDRQTLVILQEPIKFDMGLSDMQLGFLNGLSFALIYVTAGEWRLWQSVCLTFFLQLSFTSLLKNPFEGGGGIDSQ